MTNVGRALAMRGNGGAAAVASCRGLLNLALAALVLLLFCAYATTGIFAINLHDNHDRAKD